MSKRDRALLFVDGNNWYHACKDCGLHDLFALDYVRISQKLVAPRLWVGTRYYIGSLKQGHPRFDDQRRFLARLENADPLITVHLGRVEPRPVPNMLAHALSEYLATTQDELGDSARRAIDALAREHEFVSTFKEKASDVMLAVDMFRAAVHDEFDSAYLLSADGDFTPAVEAVRGLEKKVYVACPQLGRALQNKANCFIHLRREWFQDCYRFDQR